MNQYVKYGLIFVAGSGIGGVVSWFLAKRHFDAEVEKSREYYNWRQKEDEELLKEAAKIVYENKQEELNDISEDPNESEDDEDDSENVIERRGRQVVESYTDRMNRRKEDLLRPERVRYDRVTKERESSELIESNEKEVDEVLLRENDDNPRDDIYVINADQFAHERYGFDKITLYWWELERILSEEDMSILDVPDILGYGWESKIGSEEKDIVYVRNETLETDYVVEVRHESFYAMRD